MQQCFAMLPALTWMAIIFLLSSRSAVPDAPLLSQQLAAIAGHAVLYGTLTLLLLVGLLGTHQRLTSGTYAVAFTLAIAYAASDEIHQSFVPGREASLFDVAVDALGAASSLAIVWFVARRRCPQVSA